MKQLINYQNGHFFVGGSRVSGGYDNDCIIGFVEDILNVQRASCYSGCLHEAIAALCDGSLFESLQEKHGEEMVIGAVESVHAFIESAV